MARIFVVEDDAAITRHLCPLLRSEGFEVEAAGSFEQARRAIEGNPPDLALVDLALPDGHGFALCPLLGPPLDVPVIFLTAAGDEASVVAGLGLGADDYVIKPFRPMELVSRIKGALRRRGRAAALYRVGDLTLNAASATLQKSGREIALSALEYRLLLIFFNHPGQVLSRNRLMGEIWDLAGDYVNDNTLTVYIKRLREKIEDDPARPQRIKTVRGLGYKLE